MHNSSGLSELLLKEECGDQIEKVFPNLIFCERAIEQLKSEVDACNITQITKKLLELQDYFSECGSIFQKEGLHNATPESLETLKAFQKEHQFQLPNGSIGLFSWHIRFTGK